MHTVCSEENTQSAGTSWAKQKGDEMKKVDGRTKAGKAAKVFLEAAKDPIPPFYFGIDADRLGREAGK